LEIEENRGLSTTTLKIIAVVCMVVDHIPYAFPDAHEVYYVTPTWIFHAIGRVTAPIFFYLLAVGFFRTRNQNRYTIRLLVFALIAYLPYAMYFHAPDGAATLPQMFTRENALYLNVIFTMLFGLLVLRALREIRNSGLKILVIALCVVGVSFADYGVFGLALILAFAFTRHDRRLMAVVYSTLMLTYLFTAFFQEAIDAPFAQWSFYYSPPYLYYLIVLLCHFLPLFFILRHRDIERFPEPRPGFAGKWLFYIFYPAHITALLCIRIAIYGA